MKFELQPHHRNISDEELLNDIKRIADKLGIKKLSSRDYDSNGAKYTAGTIGTRFGGWNNALKKADLQLVFQRNVEQEELFNNIEEVWINLGRQPVYRDIDGSLSKYSAYQYKAKFGTWRKALEAFVENTNTYIKESPAEEVEINNFEPIHEKERNVFKHKTKREASSRLKVQVLMRDGNKCRLCGITITGDNIHFDHIKPWSKGGETTLENLQVLCAEHNLAKGNLEY